MARRCLRQLRQDAEPSIAQLPTIMLTGHSGEESEVLCLEAGADDFVTKPINQAVLRARIETQLRLRSMRIQLQQQNDELEAWRRNLERDLAAARLTQQSLIPQKAAGVAGLGYRRVLSARHSGRRRYLWLAAHGATAEHYSGSRTRPATGLPPRSSRLWPSSFFITAACEHNEPVEIMEAVNNDFRSIFGARSFMTAMCVALDPATGRASVVGAGHPPLLVARNGGRTEAILSSAPPLGLLERSEFLETNVDLEPGDAFFLYTDGLCGSGRGENPRLSSERLGEMLQPMAASAQGVADPRDGASDHERWGQTSAGRRGRRGGSALKLTDKIFSIP